ncbi:GNAT family N-acetyltransferase [Aureimonas mangrovi]|uniref:GNAT family N-acetyltransferase n=1 Tax=Aureimonas mangrovi TaxID=2758041 RepID=UPI00163DCBA3|nr:GNAT family N-acetyltransferase [Aureimonas mangrovi]
MTERDLTTVVDWAAAEGWNPGLSDAQAFRLADPEGFLVAVEDGEPVAAISVVNYDESFAFLGLYIARPDRRGRGIGRALWQAGMAHAGPRTVGLDGVVAQQTNYARSGFALAHRNVRFSGVAKRRATTGPAASALTDVDAPALAALDRRCFGAPRPAFLTAWTSLPGHHALAVDAPPGLSGFGVSRPCREGFKIGPLFAASAEIAEALFLGLIHAMPHDATVILDVPEPNAAALSLAERHGLVPVFETARMYRGKAPDLPLAEIFGLTSFELG